MVSKTNNEKSLHFKQTNRPFLHTNYFDVEINVQAFILKLNNT